MSIVLDAGALVAIERGDRSLLAVIAHEHRQGRPPLTHAGVVGQVWRGRAGPQAVLARALAGIEVRPVDEDLGRRAGVLLGVARRTDVIDAAVVLIARDGDRIFTADVGDLIELVAVSGTLVDLVAI